MDENITTSETMTNETNSEASTTTVETVDTSVETVTTTIGVSNLSEIDVESLNTFTHIGTSFILGCLFWFVCKWLYKLFNIFF